MHECAYISFQTNQELSSLSNMLLMEGLSLVVLVARFHLGVTNDLINQATRGVDYQGGIDYCASREARACEA